MFDSNSFVNCANGLIYDGLGINGNLGITFDTIYESGTFTGANWGAIRPAAIDTYTATVHWRDCAMPMYSGKYNISAVTIDSATMVDVFDFDALDAAGAKPFNIKAAGLSAQMSGIQLGRHCGDGQLQQHPKMPW
jgi:hypothetical protein